jgi:toxin YhaV
MSKRGKDKKASIRTKDGQDRKPATQEQPAVKNGWTLYAHPVLLDQLDKLKRRVVQNNNADGDAAKVLAWLVRAMFDEVPQDPTLQVYRQGKTLGKGKTHWFRDKYAGRFRLFFRFSLSAKVIIYGWVNDENSLRTYGSKTDAYQVFKNMLEKGAPPNEWDVLVKESSSDRAIERLKSEKA